MRYLFLPWAISFTEERREAAHNGGHSIDYSNPAGAANDESSDGENVGINPNAFFPLPFSN